MKKAARNKHRDEDDDDDDEDIGDEDEEDGVNCEVGVVRHGGLVMN